MIVLLACDFNLQVIIHWDEIEELCMIVGQSFHLLVPCIPIPIHPCFTTEAGLLFIQPGLQLLKLFTNSKLTVRLALPSGVGYQQDPRLVPLLSLEH